MIVLGRKKVEKGGRELIPERASFLEK